jgi:hypothetical protein
MSQYFPDAQAPSPPQVHAAVTAALPFVLLHNAEAAQHGSVNVGSQESEVSAAEWFVL